MPEPRARQYHRDRVAGTLRDEISTMIEGELSDPRISFAYVTQVVVNPGGKSALDLYCGGRRREGRSRHPGWPDGRARLYSP